MEDAIVQIQDILAFLSKFSYILLLLMAFLFTLIENVFPPFPSDVCFVVITVLIGSNGDGEIVVLVIMAGAIGATIGFWLMYLLGSKFETKIIEGNKIKFISRQSIEKVETMFKKWGMKLVAINRFISGTRAVISFFAGMSALPKIKTILYAGASSLVYYSLLAYTGYYFGKDWNRLLDFLKLYERATISIAIGLTVIAIMIWLIKKFVWKSK